jgi:phosphoglycolate phosphatase
MFDLVIFDLDGTLLNTIDDICDSINLALQDNHLPTITVDECKYMVGKGVKVLIEKAIRGHNEAYDGVMNKYMYYYELMQKNKTKPYPGVKQLLADIKEKKIKIAVLSNKPHEDTLRVIDYYFGLDQFDMVLGKKANNRPKPEIDGCIEIINTLDVKGQVLYVGDTGVDMETALKAKFVAVGVTWGFRLREELKDANYIIDEPHDIIKIIEENA